MTDQSRESMVERMLAHMGPDEMADEIRRLSAEIAKLRACVRAADEMYARGVVLGGPYYLEARKECPDAE